MAVRCLLIVALSMLVTRMTVLLQAQSGSTAERHNFPVADPPVASDIGPSFLATLPPFQDVPPREQPTLRAASPSSSLPLAPTEDKLSNQVYQRISPAVVTIYVGREIGSGSILTPDGLVITNNHVVRRAQRRNDAIRIKTMNGQEYAGQLVATNPPIDLALIKLESATTFPIVPLASVKAIQVGVPVLAIGSPLGEAGVMTQGTLQRVAPNGDLISDVELKPGNSGGPLLNLQGEMIGINKGIRPPRNGTSRITSFATNVGLARQFIDQVQPNNHSTFLDN